MWTNGQSIPRHSKPLRAPIPNIPNLYRLILLTRTEILEANFAIGSPPRRHNYDEASSNDEVVATILWPLCPLDWYDSLEVLRKNPAVRI